MRATPRRRRCLNLSHGNPPRVSTCAPDCRVLQPLRAAACFNLSTPLHHRRRRRRRSAPPPLTSSSTSTAATASGQDRPSEAHGTQKMGPCLKARGAAPRTREEHDSDPTESSRGAKPSPRQTHRLRRVGPSRPHRGQPPGPPRRAASARVEESPSYTHTHTWHPATHSYARAIPPHMGLSLVSWPARYLPRRHAPVRTLVLGYPGAPPLASKGKRAAARNGAIGLPRMASRGQQARRYGGGGQAVALVASGEARRGCMSHVPSPACRSRLHASATCRLLPSHLTASHVPSHLPPPHLTSRRPGRRRARALPDGRRCGGVAPLRRAAPPREARGAAWPNAAAGLGWGRSTASHHG